MGYTLKQAAEAAGISKNALKARLKYFPAETIYTEQKGKQTLTMLTDAGLEFLLNQGNFPFESAFSKSVLDDSEPILDSVKSVLEAKTDSEAATTDSKPITTDFKPIKTDSTTDSEKAFRMALEALQKELDRKDKEIARLHDRLAEANAGWMAAQKQLDAAQALHAGTLQRELQSGTEPEQEVILEQAAVDSDPEQPVQPEQGKKKRTNWFSRLFGRDV